MYKIRLYCLRNYFPAATAGGNTLGNIQFPGTLQSSGKPDVLWLMSRTIPVHQMAAYSAKHPEDTFIMYFSKEDGTGIGHIIFENGKSEKKRVRKSLARDIYRLCWGDTNFAVPSFGI